MKSRRRNDYFLFTLCFLSVAWGAMNSVLSSAYLPDIVRTLTGRSDDTATGGAGSWINFAFLAGGTVGGIALGFLSDRVGRKTVLLLALVCIGGGSGLGALSTRWEILAATRLLVGAGVGAVLVASAVLISETWLVRTRPVALGILSVAYPVGVIASGIVTAGVEDWRAAFGYGALAILLVVPAWLVRESSAWSAGKKAPVTTRIGDYKAELLSGAVVYGTMLVGIWATFAWLPTWLQGLLGEEAPDGQVQRGVSVMLLGMGGLAGGLLSGFLAKRFGGKPVQAVCFVLCLLLTYFIFQMNDTYSISVDIGISLLGICFGISQGVLNDYVPALFPTALRATATGLSFHIGRAFTAVAVFFVGTLAAWFGGYGNAIFAFSLFYLPGLGGLLLGGRDRRPVISDDKIIDFP